MMIKEDIPLYKLDLTGTSRFNKVTGEYMFRRTVKNNNIVIPPGAPFYQKSFKMFDKAGKLLVENEDYEFYGLMGKLTQYTGKPVGLFVRLLKEELTEWYVDYQVVGNFNKITNDILNMLHSIYEDDRYVIYENIQNKPLWFVPEIHQHDLAYEIFGFTDLVTQINRIAQFEGVTGNIADEVLDIFQERLDSYIKSYKEVLLKLINSHIANKQDAHGVYKDVIGLGNVDNFLTATLEETIEGLRDDLHITPYNAAIAADAAAGRNDKLFPSGSLPLLRYGSDTFIPPSISGSYEGMGGLYQQMAAVVESDGTMLILQRRNNGKTKGLYFLRSANWDSATPDWEFTGYTYQHPTAIAAGANLNMVVNGSNDQFMIVGDEDKNIWFWCETKGTLNPDRHVLTRITDSNWLAKNREFRRSFIMTPNDPTDAVMVVFGLSHAELLTYRPDTPPFNETGGGSRALEAFLFFVLVGSEFRQAKLSYRQANGKVRVQDTIFTPYERVQGLGPAGEKGISEYHVKWKNPILQSWTYRMLAGYCSKTGIANTYDMMMHFQIWSRAFAGQAFANVVPYRARIKVTKGTTPLIEFTPGPGEQRLYTLDINDVGNSPDYTAYYQWKVLPNVVNSTEHQGFANLHDGKIVYLGAYAGWFLPVQIVIGTAKYLKDPTGLIDPMSPTVNPWAQQSSSVCKEYNPVGLGALFINQVHMTMDTDDWTKSAVMGRQVNEKQQTEWIVRPMAFLTSTWSHNGSISQMQLSGNTVNYFPFVSQTYKTNLGPNLVLNICGLDATNPNQKDRYKQIFGADAWGRLLGVEGNGAKGDGLLVRNNSTKLVNNVVTFTPTTVYNVAKSIDRDFKPRLAAAGFNTGQVSDSWTLVQIFTADKGEIYHLFQAGEASANGRTIRVAAVLCKVNAAGSPVTKDGYQYYDDVSITFTSPVKIITYDADAIFQQFYGQTYVDGNNLEHSSINLVTGNGITNSGIGTAVVRSLARYHAPADRSTLDIIYEFRLNGTEIIRMSNFRQNHVGPENKWVVSPGNGQGSPLQSQNIMEGAGIVSQNYVYGNNGSLYDAMVSNNLSNSLQVGMSNLLVSQFVVYFNKMDNVLLAGKMYDIPATYIDIQTVDPTPANKVFYAYLYYANGQAQYAISQDVRPETSSQSMIAKIITGPSQIENIIPYNRFTMDGAQVTAQRQGSGILSTTGSVFDIGDASAILLDQDFIS
ncbi:tail protein [Kosakonia phage Kc263]|uniref:Virion structural protein n=1 Tax=Kosakonia phage Kc263 TaxID=2863194 RepID=A0AAE7WF63_9CAUD|nr:tail protein [Kosakonia phage Kc263]QYN79953.1 hypothetical protein [Kosakonia phage Kc263]